MNFRPPPAPVAANADAPVPLWTTRTGRRFSSPLEIRDNILYGGSVDRKVYAVDLGSGDVRWGRRLSGMLVGGVLLPGDTLYAATSRPEGRVYALRRANGKQIWYQSISPIAAPLALVDRVLVAQTQRGEVLGLDPGNGKIRWRRRVGVSRVAAAPAGEGGVLVATTDSLIRLTLIDGKVTHRTHSPGTIVSAWIPYPGGLVAGTTDSQVVSVDPRNLRVNWSVRLDAPVLGSPGLMGDTLFVASRLGTVYRIDPAPEPKARQIAALDWPVTAPLAIVNDKLLLGGADGTIRALRSDGSEIWRVRVWRPVEIGPVPMADGLVAIGGNGDLHRYRQ